MPNQATRFPPSPCSDFVSGEPELSSSSVQPLVACASSGKGAYARVPSPGPSRHAERLRVFHQHGVLVPTAQRRAGRQDKRERYKCGRYERGRYERGRYQRERQAGEEFHLSSPR